jgi:periplasmic nitrate reductase NapE
VDTEQPAVDATRIERRREALTFILLAVVLFPLLAVIVVSGFGFIVWMSQLLWLGPPSG